jgi:mono/diheme cytochrome c family protein
MTWNTERAFVQTCLLGTLTACGLLLACDTDHAPPEPKLAPRAGEALRVRTSGIQAGPGREERTFENPYKGNAHALRDGQRLYTWFNCGGCHGEIGGGGMGPPLRDARWIYGSRADQIYQSIIQGRPQGMPAYSGTLAEDDAWKIVAFVQSLGETATQIEAGPVGTEPEITPSAQEQREERHDDEEE